MNDHAISEQALREARRRLTNILFGKGPGATEKNLQLVLDALWEASHIVGTPGMLERSVFQTFLYGPAGIRPTGRCKYIKELRKQGCFGTQTLEESSRGRPLLRIHLVEREVPNTLRAQKSKPKEKQLATRPVAAPPSVMLVPDGFALVKKDELKRTQKRDERSAKHATFVFVDHANLCGARECVDEDGYQHGKRIVRADNVNWNAIRNAIWRIPSSREYIQGMFAYLWEGIITETVRFNAKHAGFTIVSHHKKDTDVLMSGDIGYFVRDAMARHTSVHVIIVSGDGDYARTLDHLKRAAHETNTGLTISVVIEANSEPSVLLKALADNIVRVSLDEIMIFSKDRKGRHRARAQHGQTRHFVRA